MNNILYLVVPCYNEEECLVDSSVVLKEKLNQLINEKLIDEKSRILFVNDGSKDKTWEVIDKLHSEDKIFQGLCLSRNKGHQNACLAGLDYAKDYADMLITIDADLQDDPNTIKNMVQKYLDGNEVVYGVRSKRKKDSFFKKHTAQAFYKFMKAMGVDVVYNHADYRLTSKRVLENFADYKEVNLFLRGIFPLIGYKSDVVYYERGERFAGKSKYPLKKMLNFAWDGITSFSIKPIRLVLSVGVIIFAVSVIMTLYSIIVYFMGKTVPGWTFLACSIWMLAGVQMLSLGIIGEYVGKVYNETKARPRYIISRNLNEEE